jgi:hypothetical protein
MTKTRIGKLLESTTVELEFENNKDSYNKVMNYIKNNNIEIEDYFESDDLCVITFNSKWNEEEIKNLVKHKVGLSDNQFSISIDYSSPY